MLLKSTLEKCKNVLSQLMVVALIGAGSANAAGPATLPGFTLPDLDGKPWSSSQMMGKVVVVDFWATWCTTCKETIPGLAELHAKHKDKGLVVLGISVDKGSPEKVRKAAAKFGITYLVLHDKENSLSKTFGFNGIPSVYVFDRRGDLKIGMPGYDPDQDHEVAAATEKALSERMAPVPEKVSAAPVEETVEATEASDPVTTAKKASTKRKTSTTGTSKKTK
jgi:peroxiredoxin